MGALGAIGFATPWLLWALLALPVLWWLLRAVPPAPLRRRFPAVTLLLGLKDDESETDRTPWWLLLLRCAAVAALIVGLAGPVLNPRAAEGRGPLLVLMDASWASAQDWSARRARLDALLDAAGRAGRPVALAALTDLPAGGPAFQSAEALRGRLAGVVPAAWEPEPEAALGWLAEGQEARHETVWFSDGLARPGRSALQAELVARGPLTVIESAVPRLALLPPGAEAGRLSLRVVRAPGGAAQEVVVAARGPDPNGVERELARGTLALGAGETGAEAPLDLPLELRNRIQRFEIAGLRSAGAVSLADDALRRRKVALMAGREAGEAGELLSPLHYLREALAPAAELVEGPLGDLMLAAPDVLILADVAQLAPDEAARVEAWVRRGGFLLRFAGPRLAASELSRASEDVLMPVRLRAGGRDVGGAMSWGAPRRLAPFAAESVFAGLDIPDEVTITSQVLAQPDPALADRVEAALADGTPLVTAKPLGEGRVVLFHVTANADWSNLPLSGLFVRMLERLAVAARAAGTGDEVLAGVTWTPESVLDGFGAAMEPGNLPGVPGERLAAGRPGPDIRPGLYAAGLRRVAVNVAGPDTVLAAADWPAGTAREGLVLAERRDLAGPLLVLALLLLLVDALATLALGGRLRGARAAALVAGLLLAAGGAPQAARADDMRAIAATRETVLAYVRTGDPALDRISEAGLRGLSRVLRLRTSVEPAEPMGVDIETDELAFFPFLYWPVSEAQMTPGEAAYERLNRYLRGGGMILFDTRDADIGRFGGGTPLGRAFRRLAAPLAIPPLEPVPPDHVLTRTFYLLQDFPGRHNARDVWVEAAPPGAVQAEGMPFRNLNDGVTPVVIGGNDWAAAWAIDGNGQPLLPVGRGFGGERQREMAFRFGVNLVMHVLTGNYKSDQVHVPALLERLGQ